jgi:DNA-binding CsgD family transcriptional regulator
MEEGASHPIPGFDEDIGNLYKEEDFARFRGAFDTDDERLRDRLRQSSHALPTENTKHLRPQDLLAALALTARQEHVLFLVANGYSSKRIAWTLGWSKETVLREKDILREKLGTRALYQAALLIRFRCFSDLSNTPAQLLYDKVLPELTGARIIEPIIRDHDWAGLMVILPDGRHANVWFNSDEDGDHAGWVVIQHEDDPK